MNIFVTGASGKIGRKLLPKLVEEGHSIRALQYHRTIDLPGVEVVRGSLCDELFVHGALKDMEIVIHLASCKEDKANFMSEGMKGLFYLLDEIKNSKGIRQFIQAGADASFGIYYCKRPEPIIETMRFEAYPGIYPLSKVIEETLCEQMHFMYGVPTTVLRFSWIIDQDDLLTHVTLEEPNFGVPEWRDYKCLSDGISGNVACEMVHPNGETGIRHVVDIDDVIQSIMLALDNPRAIGRAYNIASEEPFRYDELSKYVGDKLSIPTAKFIIPEFNDFSICIDRAKKELGYAPKFTANDMIDKGIEYRKSGRERIESSYKG